MEYQHENIAEVARLLHERLPQLENKIDVLKAPELRDLYSTLATLPNEQKASFGRELNDLKASLQKLVASAGEKHEKLAPIDVTAPFDVNAPRPQLLSVEQGSVHPLNREIAVLRDTFYRMGFAIEESREIDDQ